MKKLALAKKVHSALQTIALLLRSARKTKDMRQQDLAERLGVTRQTVARMEVGDPTVAIGIYAAASWILDVPILTGLENMNLEAQEGLNQIIQFLQKQLPQRMAVKREKEIDDNF